MAFTRIPNKVIDDLKLNPYQFQIFSIIVRKTDGWCKTQDGISLSQFERIVTFGKMKIISTLKELEEMQLIVKNSTFRKDGGRSFNFYKVSPTLVSQVDRGSISGGQGLVSQVDRQKKTNTKETNTNIKKSKTKKSFYEIFIEGMKESFRQNKLLTYKDKINNCKDELKEFEDHEELIMMYTQYVKKNKTMSARLNKFLVALKENNLDNIQYSVKQQSNKKRNISDYLSENIDEFIEYQSSNSQTNYIDTEVSESELPF